MKDFRQKQTARGNEAVLMLAKFLEKHAGLFSVSINETGYSQGNMGIPDMQFGVYAIEVKRCEMITCTQAKDESFRFGLSNIKVYSACWQRLKEYCYLHNKYPKLVCVVTSGKHEPIFLGFQASQIDNWIEQRKHGKKEPTICKRSYLGFTAGPDIFKALAQGTILNQNENFAKFFDKLKGKLQWEKMTSTA